MKINSVLKEVLEKIKPPEEKVARIEEALKGFVSGLESRISKGETDAEVFVGGSFAKGTLIKKDKYDIDIFLRFGKTEENISDLTEGLLKGLSFERVHGSRDYFRIKIEDDLYFEVVPVKKVKKQEEAENITDLSFFHVRYLRKKVKSEKILDEIRLAKAFCFANHCYGAESYINGFSGYALELMVYYYMGFVKFLQAMKKARGKIVIDIEKKYKTKREVMMNLNASKLQSPVVLIDPTYKQRNALAALSQETFDKFKKAASEFLKKPSEESFEQQKTDLEKIKKDALENDDEFILLETDTDRQPGDIAGSKLLKFYRHLENEIGDFFEVKDKGFNYNKDRSARYFFVVKSKGELLVKGPEIKDDKNLARFKKKHKDYFTKEGRIYAKKKGEKEIVGFIDKWKRKNRKKMKEMCILKLGVLD